MGRPGAWGTWRPPRLGDGSHRLHTGEYSLSLKEKMMSPVEMAGGRSDRDHLQRGNGKHLAARSS